MVIIIGGGITGLSLAYILNLKGYKVIVIEKETQLGGNASWTNLGNFIVDKFYHVITNRDLYLLDWFKELGIQDKLFPIKARMGFYQNGKLYSLSSPKEFLFFPPLSFKERIQLGLSVLRSKLIRNWERLDGITAASWLSDLSGKSTYKKVWEPIMRSKFGPATDEIVATDMWFRINRIADAKDKRIKEGVYSIKGTIKTFFDSLEKRLEDRGVKFIKGNAVEKIHSYDGNIKGVLLSNGEEISSTNVIVAIPLPDFIQLLPDGFKEYGKKLSSIKYLNNICLMLRLRERFSPYYMINLGEGGFPFTGIIGADALYPAQDFGRSYILCVSKYFLGENDLFYLDKEELLEYYLPYLKKIVPRFQKEWVLDIAVTKKKNVEAIHSLHYSKLMPSFETPIKNLYLLCTAQIYPEPTVLDASVKYANMLVNKFF